MAEGCPSDTSLMELGWETDKQERRGEAGLLAKAEGMDFPKGQT